MARRTRRKPATPPTPEVKNYEADGDLPIDRGSQGLEAQLASLDERVHAGSELGRSSTPAATQEQNPAEAEAQASPPANPSAEAGTSGEPSASPEVQEGGSPPPPGEITFEETPQYIPPEDAPAVPDIPATGAVAARGTGESASTRRASAGRKKSDAATAKSHDVAYTSRIAIVSAWQFDGKLSEAPDYVDRSWLARGRHDPVRGIQPGPAVSVPLPPSANDPGAKVLVRVGDYIVEEVFTNDLGNEVFQVAAYPKETFEKFFMKVERV